MRQRMRNKRQFTLHRIREQEQDEDAKAARQKEFMRRWRQIQKDEPQPAIVVPPPPEEKKSLWTRIKEFLRWR